MLKNILNLLMIIMMVGTLVPLQANLNKVKAAKEGNWIDVADTSWYGDGFATKFNISTAEQLAGLAQL